MAVSSVASAATSTTLAAANRYRRGIKITNTDANALYVLIDDTQAATTSLYSFVLAQGDTWEGDSDCDGRIVGIWAADGTGAALVTEY